MPKNPYCVFVVLEQEYGAGLLNLLPSGPIWAVNTSTNRVVAQDYWSEHPEISYLDGITVFDFANDASPEDTLVSELANIDLHHGIHSADPPYTILEIIGTNVTERIKQELGHYGFNRFDTTSAGFRAIRPLQAFEG
jgi:hypothetical protein